MDKKKKPLHLRVQARDRTIYDGDVKVLTSYNDKGKFDVLPGHANFISLVQKALILRDMKGKVEQIVINSGVMRVINNNIEVYMGIKME